MRPQRERGDAAPFLRNARRLTLMKRIGLPNAPHVRPILDRLTASGAFECVVDLPAHLAIRMRDRSLHAALLTPIDYARESSEYLLIRDGVISSSGPSGAISLRFHPGAHAIASLAVDPSSLGEIVLARIILAEEFDSRPALVPVAGTVEQMLQKADAALVLGGTTGVSATSLDLVEAWQELTGLSYCHAVWCWRVGALTDGDIHVIQDAHRQAAADTGGAFAYCQTGDTDEALRAFLHYAFYHGIIQDIPDVRYDSAEDEPPDPPASLN